MVETNTALSPQRTRRIVAVLLFVSPLIGMVVDLIAPSLPAITSALKVSASSAKNIIAIYLLGYALGNFISGFLADAFGRRQLLRGGLLGFALSSVLPVLFPNIETILIVRLIQGLAIGTVSVVVRSIYADILTPDQLVRFGVVLATMWGLGPVIGPAIGGYLQTYFGWQSGFFFFFCVSLLLLIAIFIVVPETYHQRRALNFRIAKNNILEVISHRSFISLSVMMGLSYSLLIVFNTVAPFLIQTRLHYSPVFYGQMALILGIVFLIATTLCRFLLKHFTMEQLLLSAVTLFFGIALLMTLLSYSFHFEIQWIIAGSALMFIGCGFIFPLSMGKGMSLFRHIAGTATAVMFLINILLTSLSAFFLSFITVKSAFSLMLIYLSLMLLVTLTYWKLFHQRSSD